MNMKKNLVINKYDILGNERYTNLEELKKYDDLEDLIIKNFEIKDEEIDTINRFDNLKRICFINCNFKIKNTTINDVPNIELILCENINKNLLNYVTKELVIENCKGIEFDGFLNNKLEAVEISENLVREIKFFKQNNIKVKLTNNQKL